MNLRGDTIVVGAGPAGAATACLLQQMGRQVILLDVSAFPRQKVCGEYLSPLGWETLSQLGLHQLRTDAVSLRRLRIAAPQRPTIEVALPADPQQQPAAVSRTILDTLLVEAAVSTGVQLLTEHRLREVIITGDRVTGVVAVPVDDPSETVTISGAQIVAADGRHSVVVRQTGTVYQNSSIRRRAPLVGFKRHLRVDPHDELLGDAISMFSLSGGYAGLCRVDDHSANFCGVIPAARLRETRGDIGAALRLLCAGHDALAPWLTAAEPLGPWSTVADVSAQRSEPRLAGVLYVGDAMGTIEPLTGQGMTMALVAGAMAADLLACSPTGIERPLQQAYSQLWQRSFQHTIRHAAWFGWLLRHPLALQAILTPQVVRTWLAPWITRSAQRHLAVSTARGARSAGSLRFAGQTLPQAGA